MDYVCILISHLHPTMLRPSFNAQNEMKTKKDSKKKIIDRKHLHSKCGAHLYFYVDLSTLKIEFEIDDCIIVQTHIQV